MRSPRGIVPWLALRIIGLVHRHRLGRLVPYELYLRAGEAWTDRYIEVSR